MVDGNFTIAVNIMPGVHQAKWCGITVVLQRDAVVVGLQTVARNLVKHTLHPSSEALQATRTSSASRWVLVVASVASSVADLLPP